VSLALLYPATGRAAPGTSPRPADRFIQSVVARDGELGWQQLCPDVQAQIPRQVVRDQALAQRAAEAGQDVHLRADFVEAQPRASGGETRVYLVTARHRNSEPEQKKITVTTEASGCVTEVT
jgi:hypothetical protein